MKYFIKAIWTACFVTALANSSVKPTESSEAKRVHCNVNFNNFYAGPNCKNIERQLAKINEGIASLTRNESGGPGGNDLFSELKQQVDEMKQEIRALKGNSSTDSGEKVYKNCAEAYQFGKQTSGVYKIDPDGLGEFEVYCDQRTAGGGWTMLQKRRDGSVYFFRGWDDYKRGFGNLNGEFWLGLDKIHRLTVNKSNRLRVDLQDADGETAYAQYSSFALGDETEKYKLSLGKYYGTAGDALYYNRGSSFSTKDRDNDKHQSGNCALMRKGAWWYNFCSYSNLNGLYLQGKRSQEGMVWYQWKKCHCSVERSQMKIRPKDF